MAAGEEGLEGITIRRLREMPEYDATVPLQVAVWGYIDLDIVPPRILQVATLIGGIVLGVYEGREMIGFSFSMPGHRADGSTYLHSHMTAVLKEHQNRGIGRRLKLFQRQAALAEGYKLIEWTFDPLEIRNAHFNIERLGVVVNRYKPNAYGITSSPLHGAIPTDRLVAEWHLAGPRVRAMLDEGRRLEADVEATVDVPAAAAALRNSDPEQAAAMQTAVRERFIELLSRGLTVIGYSRTDEGGRFEFGRYDKDQK